MRRFLFATIIVLLAGCAGAPETAVEQSSSAPPVRAVDPRHLIGLTGQELAQRLRSVPTLQIREGSSIKLQFRSTDCVLDAYLYPQGGQQRVEHVDARSPTGADRDEQQCVLDFQRSAS